MHLKILMGKKRFHLNEEIAGEAERKGVWKRG